MLFFSTGKVEESGWDRVISQWGAGKESNWGGDSGVLNQGIKDSACIESVSGDGG